MTLEEIHKDDIGTEFLLTVKDETGAAVDISAATTTNILFQKPDSGTILTKTATFKTTGVDGKITYSTIVGDLDTVGLWRYQAHIIFSGKDMKSSVNTFHVYDNLE